MRDGKPALSSNDPIPLPAPNQAVYPPAGAAAKVLPGPERQLIAEIRVELVLEAVGGASLVQVAIVGTEKFRRLIFARRRQDGGVQIQHLPISVIRFERQPPRGALEYRHIHRVIAGGTLTKPGLGVRHIGVRALLERDSVDDYRRPGRHVGGSLRNNGRLSGWMHVAASASLRVLAHLGRGRIGIHCEIGVAGLAADGAHRKHPIFGKLAFHRQVPYLDGRGEHVRIETGGLINRARCRYPWAARRRERGILLERKEREEPVGERERLAGSKRDRKSVV